MPRETYFTKQVAVTHRNTVISHIIYFKFALAPVCIVSIGRLFVHKGNMACMSELEFSCDDNYVVTILKIDYRGTFQNLFNLGLEYCYGLFQAIKYSVANWKSSKYSRNNHEQTLQEMDSEKAIFAKFLLTTLITIVLCTKKFSPITKSSRL